MSTTQAAKVLAPYGSVRFVQLATKVGGDGAKSISSQDKDQRRVVRLKSAA